MIEQKRGCGYRKIGGLYFVGDGLAYPCDRLNYDLHNCDTCGAGIKFSRGFTWINWSQYTHKQQPPHENCKCDKHCPICHPMNVKVGLMWVGEKFYTPDQFIAESKTLGISKRIAAIPKGFETGKTWILLAHKHAGKSSVKYNPKGEMVSDDKGEPVMEKIPAVFYAFMPKRIEKLIWESQADEKTLKDLNARGITPVIVNDGDPDHVKGAKLKQKPEDVKKASKDSMQILTKFDDKAVVNALDEPLDEEEIEPVETTEEVIEEKTLSGPNLIEEIPAAKPMECELENISADECEKCESHEVFPGYHGETLHKCKIDGRYIQTLNESPYTVMNCPKQNVMLCVKEKNVAEDFKQRYDSSPPEVTVLKKMSEDFNKKIEKIPPDTIKVIKLKSEKKAEKKSDDTRVLYQGVDCEVCGLDEIDPTRKYCPRCRSPLDKGVI